MISRYIVFGENYTSILPKLVSSNYYTFILYVFDQANNHIY